MPFQLPPGSPLWLVIVAGFCSLITLGVASWRKFRAGAIQDEGTLLERAYRDNSFLRLQVVDLNADVERERKQRRHAEDKAAIWYRQLIEAGLTPKEVPNGRRSRS